MSDRTAMYTQVVAQRDAALEVLRPFARLGRHFRKAHPDTVRDYGDTLHAFHFVVGETAELRLSDCLAALEFWQSHRPGEEP